MNIQEKRKRTVKHCCFLATLIAASALSGLARAKTSFIEDTKVKTPASWANVYIYRHETFGAAAKMPVLIDEAPIGATAAKTYIFKRVPSGLHVITSKTENDATIQINTLPGKNYFIWQEVKFGGLAARSQLHLVDELKGRLEIKKCEPLK